MVDVVVEFEYIANEDDELTIKIGEIINDVNKMEGGWWEGSLNGKRGMFPDNFVKELKKDKPSEPVPVPNNKKTGSNVANLAMNLGQGGIKIGLPPPAQPKADKSSAVAKKVYAKVTFQYIPQHEDELGLEVGEKIEVTKQDEEGWWEGLKGSKTGVFPSNFVELITEEHLSSDEVEKNEKEKDAEHQIKGKKVKGVGLGDIFGGGPIRLRSRDETESKPEVKSDNKVKKAATPPPAAKEPPALPPKETKEPKPVQRAKVLFSYEAENDDELNLEEGATIVVLEKELEDSGWWKGELNGKIGVFPDNFVQLLPQEGKRLPRVPQDGKVGRALPPADSHEPPRPPKKEEDKKVNPKTRTVQAPPPVGKKPLKHDDPKLIAQTDDMKAKEMDAVQADFVGIESSEKLTHITAKRVKAPDGQRPPGPKTRNRYQNSGDPTDPQNHQLHSVAPNTLPQLKRPNPLQASVHPIPVRPRTSIASVEVDESPTPPQIKEREEKNLPKAFIGRPPPPTPKEESLESPFSSPRSQEAAHKESNNVPQVNLGAADVESLRKEYEKLKANTVSREDYNALQQDLQHMREDMDKMRTQFHKKILDLMKEVDEEKKIRLNMQVEMDRVKKLVFHEDDGNTF